MGAAKPNQYQQSKYLCIYHATPQGRGNRGGQRGQCPPTFGRKFSLNVHFFSKDKTKYSNRFLRSRGVQKCIESCREGGMGSPQSKTKVSLNLFCPPLPTFVHFPRPCHAMYVPMSCITGPRLEKNTRFHRELQRNSAHAPKIFGALRCK